MTHSHTPTGTPTAAPPLLQDICSLTAAARTRAAAQVNVEVTALYGVMGWHP